MNAIKLRKDYQEITKDLLITPLISEKDFIIKFLKKDFGDLEQEDIESNLDALENGGRLLSSYNIPTNIYDSNLMMNNKIWIITEAERDCTTILFPSEY